MVTFSVQDGFEQTASSLGVAPFDNTLGLLRDFGFFRVVLPFLLVWGITYAILIKTKVLGDSENPTTKNIAGIIAAVAGFFFISYTPVVEAISILLPQASFLLILALLVLMTLAFIIPDYDTKSKNIPKWGVGILVFLVILVFLGITGFAVGDNVPILKQISLGLSGQVDLPPLPEDAINQLLAIGIVLILPLLVIWFMVGGSKKQTNSQGFEIRPRE